MTPAQRIGTLYKQFGFLAASRFALWDVLRKLLDPWSVCSYSQSGEDRIISAWIGHDTGIYVDVGCNHPRRFSNTFALYKRGWRGINVDANAALIKLFKRARPRDVSICAAVSDSEGQSVFTEFADPLVSSLDEAHVAQWKQSRAVAAQRLVRTVTLNMLLSEHGVPRSFDLLSIDVEGHDFEVLSSLDLTSYRPTLIVIEMHAFDLTEATSNRVYQHLSRHGYEMVSYATPNGYFRDTRADATAHDQTS